MTRCPRCGEDGERIAAPVYREDVPVFGTWYCPRCGVSYPVLLPAPGNVGCVLRWKSRDGDRTRRRYRG